jgi:hypothetical protein
LGVFSVKNGQLDYVVITDYDLAKQANAMEELADRPPYEFFQWYMKYHNGGWYLKSKYISVEMNKSHQFQCPKIKLEFPIDVQTGTSYNWFTVACVPA